MLWNGGSCEESGKRRKELEGARTPREGTAAATRQQTVHPSEMTLRQKMVRAYVRQGWRARAGGAGEGWKDVPPGPRLAPCLPLDVRRVHPLQALQALKITGCRERGFAGRTDCLSRLLAAGRIAALGQGTELVCQSAKPLPSLSSRWLRRCCSKLPDYFPFDTVCTGLGNNKVSYFVDQGTSLHS